MSDDVRLLRSLTMRITDDPGPGTLRAWDDLVRSCPLADVTQLSAWARLRRRVGYRARYVLVEDDGLPVAGAQILARRVPVLGELAYLPYGPLVAPALAGHGEVHDLLARGLRDLVGRRTTLFVQPPQGGERAAAALTGVGFSPSTAEVAPAASLHVDLTVHEEELRRGLSRRLQRWTRTWEKRGVTVRPGDEDDVPIMAGLLARTAEHQGFSPFGSEYLQAMHRELSPSGNLVSFVGEVDRRPVAMAVFTGCGTVLRARLVGLDRGSDTHRLNVSAAVLWTAMLWARRAGYSWFDFGGLLPESVPPLLGDGPLDPEALAGPDRYKARFGGRLYRCPAPLELIGSPVLRLGHGLARRSRAGSRLLESAQRMARAGSVLPGRADRSS